MASLIFETGLAAETPAPNRVAVYAKQDGRIYAKDENGIETLLSNSEVSLLNHLIETNPHPQYLLKNNSRKIEYIQINPTHIIEKKIILDKVPINPQFVQVDLKEGGGPLFFGADFIVQGNELSWDNLEYDYVIEVDDKLRIIYDHN